MSQCPKMQFCCKLGYTYVIPKSNLNPNIGASRRATELEKSNFLSIFNGPLNAIC